MSGSQNALKDGGVQKPLFAPVNQAGDEVDLNDIFADYFINEFDDPLNAYTSSMANYTGAAAAVALAQQQAAAPAAGSETQPSSLAAVAPQAAEPSPLTMGQVATAANSTNLSLPTGRGIKTAWHAGALPVVGGGGTVLQQGQAHYVSMPLAKKHKGSEAENQTLPAQTNHNASSTGVASQQNKSTVPATPVISSSTSTPATAAVSSASGAISGRLGFSMIGGQLAVPQRGGPSVQQMQGPGPSAKQSAGNVALPVGVGIRLGGIGGAVAQGQAPVSYPAFGVGGNGQIASATAGQAAAPGQFLMWGGIGGAVGGGEGGMSEQAIAERRQRNREHAKRSRVRKKFMLESLQEQVRGLQKENVELRMLIQEKIPLHAQKIIEECCTKSPLFGDNGDIPRQQSIEPTDDRGKSEVELVRSDFSLIESLTSGQQNFVLSDPRLPDNPIVYASEGFFELTGYTREQVLGRNCRFLQGPGTDPRAVDVIRTAIANGTDCTTCLLNYKADGTPFWNQFFVAALRDSDNCIVNFVGVQCEVEPEAGATALEDKVNSVMPLAIKGEGDEKG